MKRWIALLIALTVASSQGIPPVFRLHVIANSDSAEDQAVKLKVRDAIIEQMGEMDGAADREQAEAYTKEHLQELVERANQVLRKNGFSYTATAEIGSFDFPDKTYGGICFPAGTYRALRIHLGQSVGQNWWCVLFPPLCLLEPTQTEANWQMQDGVEYQSFFANLFK